MSNTIDLICKHCKNNYTLLSRRYNQKIKKGTKNFFCSNNCSLLYRKETKLIINTECKQCHVPISKTPSEIKKVKNVFCSTSCAASFNNKGKTKNSPVERSCLLCFQPYFHTNDYRSRYCQKCSLIKSPSKLHKRTLKECTEKLAIKGKHPSWRSVYVRNSNYSLNKNIKGTPCQVCNYSFHTELAHIKPVTEFDESATLEEINSSDNILVLCPNHHWEFDHEILSLNNIPPRNPMLYPVEL